MNGFWEAFAETCHGVTLVGGGTLQEVILANVSNSIDRKLRVALMEFGTPKNYIDFLTTRWNIGNFLNFGPGGAGCGFNHPDSNRLELKPLQQKSFFLSNIEFSAESLLPHTGPGD